MAVFNPLYPIIYLVGGIPTPLKNMSSSVGMMTFPIYGKMFQTTNQGSMSMLPSGNDCYIAIENGQVEIVDLPIDSMVIFRFLYVYQRVSRFETVENHHEN